VVSLTCASAMQRPGVLTCTGSSGPRAEPASHPSLSIECHAPWRAVDAQAHAALSFGHHQLKFPGRCTPIRPLLRCQGRRALASLEGWQERTAANYIVQKWQVTVGAWSVANTHERQRPGYPRMTLVPRCVRTRRRRRLVGRRRVVSRTEPLFGWRPSAAADAGLMGFQLGCQNRPDTHRAAKG